MTALLGQLMVRMAKRIGYPNLMIFGLLLTLMFSALRGLLGILSSSINPFILILTVLLAAIMTWIVAQTRLSTPWLVSLVFPGGLVIYWIIISGLSPYITRLGLGLFVWIYHYFLSMQFPHGTITIPSTSAILQSITELNQASSIIINRFILWIQSISANRTLQDPLIITFVWSGVFWFSTAWATLFQFRYRNPLLAVLPTGILLAYYLDYTNSSAGTLIVFLGVFVLFYSINHIDKIIAKWSPERRPYHSFHLEIGMIVTALAASFMLIATILPSLSIRQINQALHELLNPNKKEEQIVQSLGLQIQPKPGGFNSKRGSALPNSHLIGAGPELSQNLVMFVSVEGYNSVQPGSITRENPPTLPPRYYWRNLTYDIYTGRGWLSSPLTEVEVPENDEITSEVNYTSNQHYKIVRQSVQWIAPSDGLVYVTGDLISVDTPIIAAWRPNQDFFGARLTRQIYQASSRIPILSQQELQRIDAEYPAWLQETYTQLPNTLPKRVQELAFTISALESTPIDRARAIEAYLRQYPYTLDVPAPPAGVDVVDYFLFDLRQGYCDYYASSMVVLSRIIGLPARLVTGYASGFYDLPNGRFSVTEADAHSWAEIYFPGIGWVEFEPTSARPLIEHPGETPSLSKDSFSVPALPISTPDSKYAPTIFRFSPLTIAIIILISILIILILSWVYRTWQKERTPTPKLIIQYYHQLQKTAQTLGYLTLPHQTPYEFLHGFIDHIGTYAPTKMDQEKMKNLISKLDSLTDYYIRVQYSSSKFSDRDKDIVIDLWQGVIFHLLTLPLRKYTALARNKTL